jgi:hypothetical protein
VTAQHLRKQRRRSHEWHMRHRLQFGQALERQHQDVVV